MPHPLLYEVNTRCWLRALSEKNGTAISLANVPESELASWRKLGFTHIWLMGAWTTSPARARGGLEASRTAARLRRGPAGLAGSGCGRLALCDRRLPRSRRRGRRFRPGDIPPAAQRAGVEVGAGLRAQPRGPGSFVDQGTARVVCAKPQRSPRNISRSKPVPVCAGWPTAKTPTLRPGRIPSSWITAAPPHARR